MRDDAALRWWVLSVERQPDESASVELQFRDGRRIVLTIPAGVPDLAEAIGAGAEAFLRGDRRYRDKGAGA